MLKPEGRHHTGNRKTMKLKKGSDVEAAARKAAAEAGLLEASGCGQEELPLATEERDVAAPQPFFSFAACACCNDADCDAVLDLPEGGFFCGECVDDVTNAERVEEATQAALDGRAAAAAPPQRRHRHTASV
tara:strand:+ start:191 stop:586 length:396 start_codon:yes stop_codon:yes gene_type:complete